MRFLAGAETEFRMKLRGRAIFKAAVSGAGYRGRKRNRAILADASSRTQRSPNVSPRKRLTAPPTDTDPEARSGGVREHALPLVPFPIFGSENDFTDRSAQPRRSRDANPAPAIGWLSDDEAEGNAGGWI